MSRFDDEIRPIITHEAAVLSGLLNDSLGAALYQAKSETKRYDFTRFSFLMPMNLRCAMRLELEQAVLPAGWTVGGNPKLMGQLFLSNDEHAIDLRFLKERRRTYPGGIAPAGRNRARIAAYSTRETPFPGLECDLDVGEVERTTILWVWDLAGPLTDEHPAFTQRLVHTTSPGVYGRAVPCDLSLDLLPTGEVFDRLEFPGGEEKTNFFEVELDETVEDED